MNHIKIICLILCCILLLSFAACIPNRSILPDSTIEPTGNIPTPTINPTSEQTLTALKQEIMERGGTYVQENELLISKYWDMYCDVVVDAVKPIKENEFSKLESLAYIFSSNKPFLFVEKISDNYLVPLSVMYVASGYDSVYQDTHQYQDLAYKEYSDYMFYNGQYTYPSRVKAVQEKHIKRIVKELFGIDISSSPEPNTYLSGDANYADGMYYFEYGDYISYKMIVSSYYYLGDDTYIVAFDGDESELDGPAEDKNGIIPQIDYFVVRRANTPLGFTVISKLRGRFDNDLFNTLTMPEGFVPVEQSE